MGKLELGQRIWLEIRSYFHGNFYGDNEGEENIIFEYEVIKINKSSAYITEVCNLEKEKRTELRVQLSNLKVISIYNTGSSYTLWTDLEEFKTDKKRKKDTAELKKLLHDRINHMDLEELSELFKKI